MRISIALVFLAAACSGPKTKPEGPLVKEGSAMPDACCCKSTPIASEDAKPLYEMANPMECSSKQGTCVDAVQCTTTSPE
jgi:hypothetical protein